MVSDAGRAALPRSKSLVGTLLGLLPDLVLSLPAGRSPGSRRVVVASKILKPCCTPTAAPRLSQIAPATNYATVKVDLGLCMRCDAQCSMVSDAGRDALRRSKSLVGTLIRPATHLVLSLVLTL